MMRFSERYGHTVPKSVMQIESMDTDLKIGLWNGITMYYFSHGSFDLVQRLPEFQLYAKVWIHYFKRCFDEMPGTFNIFLSEVKKIYFNGKWYDVYNLIEYIIKNDTDNDRQMKAKKNFNKTLECELSGYRIVNNDITLITNDNEIREIETAIEASKPYCGVQIHLTEALNKLSDKQNPDFRNSIKESISAIESLACEITGNPKAKLGDALGLVRKKKGLHPALEKAFSALYGYTSDADGIRHKLLDESTVTFADAKFMLISCSAFVNYLIEKCA